MSTLYKVSSLIALVMNKPNMFSQVLGILNKGDQIDVISISKSWAYFKYNNINAYVKKGNLKMLNTEPIESKGSVTLKYIDITTNNEIYPSETINNLNLGKYSYEAKVLYNYKLQSNSTQSVNLTEEDPDQVIIFYYNKILGSITIKYIDKNVNTDIYEPKVIENLSLGTYTYGAINISGYVLSDNEIKTVTITETSPNTTITFKYAEILGTVTIRYIDNSSYAELSEADTFTDLKLGTYSYNYKNIPGYSLANDSTQTVELTDDNHDVEIEFKYNELLGSITIKYIDSSSLNEIETATVISNLSLGTYSYSAKSFEGYEIIGDSSQSVTLNDSNLNAIISFNYSRISGSITIKYLDSSTLSEIAPSITISNIALGSYTYDAIYIDNYEIDGDSSISTTLTVSNPNQTISFKYNRIENVIPDVSTAYKVPYISTYYFNTKPTIYEDVIIPFYVTNYDQSEYLYDEEIKLDVLYQVDENSEKVITVSAGDNSINLGKLSKGEHYFSLQALDKSTNLKSHKLYNEVLVIDDSYTITEEQTYTITDDDLYKYNITKVDTTDKTKMSNNRIGLTKLFADLQSQGYRKCILPPNSYFRCKKTTGNDLEIRNGAIQIPSNFTVDMNNSIFKLHTNKGDINNTNSIVDLLVRMNNCYDSHLINGTLEGDRAERKALGLETGYKGEAISTFQFLGGKYCSIENLKIKQTTGHTVMSAGGISGGGTSIPNTRFEKTLIYEGKIINSDLWSTSQFIDLNKFTLNYITVGRYLGYRGVRGKSLIVYYNFYDENYNFIKMIVGYQYRKTRIPSIAKYIRVSFYGDLSTDTNVSMFYFELGTNLEIKNIDFEDTRTCAIATTTSSGLLIDNVTFTRCGYSITPCPVDFEDGWQDCQDIYFMNSKRIGDRVGTADIIDNAGYNHIYENNDNIGYTIRYSVIGLVIRNNNNMFSSSWQRGYETGSKFGRIKNNIINGLFNSSTDDTDTKGIVMSLIENSTINCNGLLGASTKTFCYKNCTIYKFNGNRIKAINSKIHPSPYLGYDFIFKNCEFYNFDNIDSNIKFSFNALNVSREFVACTFNSPSELASHNNFNSGIFTNCIFEKSVSITPNQPNTIGDLQFNNCIFKNNITIKITNANCYIQFNNCIFEGTKTFSNYGEVNSIFN